MASTASIGSASAETNAVRGGGQRMNLIDDSLAFVEGNVDSETRAAIIMRLPRLYLLLSGAQADLGLFQDAQRLQRGFSSFRGRQAQNISSAVACRRQS